MIGKSICVYTHVHIGSNSDINILRYLFSLYSLATAVCYNIAGKIELVWITGRFTLKRMWLECFNSYFPNLTVR